MTLASRIVVMKSGVIQQIGADRGRAANNLFVAGWARRRSTSCRPP